MERTTGGDCSALAEGALERAEALVGKIAAASARLGLFFWAGTKSIHGGTVSYLYRDHRSL
jgi:hypothetical protein